jgi:MSHA biogenesis protein MshJ
MATRFDALSIRERLLVVCAVLGAVVMLWTLMVLDPIAGKTRAFAAEKASLEEQIAATRTGVESANALDPRTLALAEEKKAQLALDAIDVQLASTSAGLIPPERMVQVIHDVLSRQHGVTLVSLHNKPVTSLVTSIPQAPEEKATTPPPVPSDEDEETPPEPPTDEFAAEPVAPEPSGPFVHPVEIVIEGSYLDVLAYLKALESLEWRFYWKVLDLETQRYPVNRVRIELSTLSMDKDWIGV